MADEEREDQPEGQEPEAEGGAPEQGADAPEGEAPATDDAPAPDTGNGEEPAPEEAPAAEAPAEDAPAEDAPAADAAEDAPAEDAPAEEAPAADAPAADAPAADSAEEAPAADAPAADAAEEAPAADAPAEGGEEPRQRGGRGREKGEKREEVIPGAHLEPDLVLEEQQRQAAEGEFGEAGAVYAEDEAEGEPSAEGEDAEQPLAREPLDLAADARYLATGKRKTAVARVILKPGDGVYTINGRHLDQFFPRVRLQRMAQQPLETAGYNGRMDVVARIHGGGVSAQAGALRHGIARALVEADPNLRLELKRRGFLTRDPREKERKKAGLKKARKRPQFSKR
jgi:small subunit ribosomal protein S9